MTSKLLVLVLGCACLTTGAFADTAVTVPVNKGDVPVTDVGTTPPSPTTSSGSGSPYVTDNVETFSGTNDGGSITLSGGQVPSSSSSLNPAETQQAVGQEDDPVGDIQADQNRFGTGRRRLHGSRKMLGELELGSTTPGQPAYEAGVPAAQTGVEATAVGHGDLDGPPTDLSDNHIQAHGVDGEVTTAGTTTPVSTEANPDCVGTETGANEGASCTGANVGK